MRTLTAGFPLVILTLRNEREESLHRVFAVATPAMTIHWFVKFGDLKSADPDFGSARQAAIAVGIISTVVLVILIAATLFLHFRS